MTLARNLAAREHIAKPLDAVFRTVTPPGQRVGVERARRQRIAHRADAGRRAANLKITRAGFRGKPAGVALPHDPRVLQHIDPVGVR